MPMPASVPLPIPLQSHPADEWFHHSMENLEFQPKSQESKNRAQWHDASLQKEEKPRKQVQFEVDEELGDELDLPSDLTHFVAKAQLQSNGMFPVWLLGHPQVSSEGALPKVLAAASTSQSHS